MSRERNRPSVFNFSDPSLWAVILGNLLSIVVALIFGWSMGEMLWIYWGQSVIIGTLNVRRILSLKEFSTKNFTMNDEPVPETPEAKRSVAVFFAFHYGFFHFVYAVFLWQELALDSVPLNELIFLVLCMTGFLVSHGYSLSYNAGRDFKHQKPNIGTLMFYPYIRILPMHLIIIFGHRMEGMMVMLAFMAMKTVADAAMHMAEHYLFQKPEKGFSARM